MAWNRKKQVWSSGDQTLGSFLDQCLTVSTVLKVPAYRECSGVLSEQMDTYKEVISPMRFAYGAMFSIQALRLQMSLRRGEQRQKTVRDKGAIYNLNLGNTRKSCTAWWEKTLQELSLLFKLDRTLGKGCLSI